MILFALSFTAPFIFVALFPALSQMFFVRLVSSELLWEGLLTFEPFVIIYYIFTWILYWPLVGIVIAITEPLRKK